MPRVVPALLIAFALSLPSARPAAAAGKFPDFKPGKSDVTFTESPPHSAADEVRARLGASDKPGPYDLAKEKFRIYIPKSYSHDQTWGLFVWINPGDDPGLPGAWEPVLEKHKLLAVAAFKSGNSRPIFDRMRLAIDGNFNMQQRFHIDPKRVYISGFSGGGRVSSMMGVGYSDIFAGAFPVCGVNFYTHIPVPSAVGKSWALNFLPPKEVLTIAKKSGRFVLLTGEKDFNRENTHAVYEKGYVKEGFKNTLYLEVPGLGHSPPGADWFEKGIEFLEKEK